MGIIFYFSNQPDLPRAPQPWLDLLLKKLAHVAEYTVLFVLLRRAWRRTLTSELALSVSLVITAAYAVSDEVHQAFVPGRHANAYDVAIDLTGVLLLWCLFRRRDAASRRRRQHPDLAE
jgi:VanZ family protein